MNKEELIQSINQAFDGVPQPKDITLHVAEAHDDYDYEHDAEHRQKDFIGRWQDVPNEHIQKCRCAMSYVDAVGMRYYLPAQMIWYLKNFGNSKIVVDDMPLYTLDPHDNNENLRKYQQERFSLFSPEQLKACAHFVKFCAEDETRFTDTTFAEKVYERYWKKFG